MHYGLSLQCAHSEHHVLLLHQHQHRHGEGRRQQARRDQVFERVGRQGGERVDLLGHLHGADLGRIGRGHLAGEQGGGEQGRDLAGEAEGEQAAQRAAASPR